MEKKDSLTKGLTTGGMLLCRDLFRPGQADAKVHIGRRLAQLSALS
jgi:hypothetical protein